MDGSVARQSILRVSTRRYSHTSWIAAFKRAASAPLRDLCGTRACTYGLGVTLLAIAVAALYYHNNPLPFQPYHDSLEYVFNAQRILAGGTWADADRMPGYPLLLAVVFAIRGGVDLRAAEIAQYILFVLTALEVYVLAYRIWGRAALAGGIGALFGTNLYLLEYVQPLLSDALAMWLCVTLCLSIVYYIERPRPLRLWLVALLLLALTMTRAEWYLAPIGVFPFLLLVAMRAGYGKRIAPHALLALCGVLGVVVLYMQANAAVSGYHGLSEAENINLWGKVVQYKMVTQAPPKYADITSITEQGTKVLGGDVWGMYWTNPVLGAHHFARVGAYARAVILAHPWEFLRKSVPLVFSSLPAHAQWSGIVPKRGTTWLLDEILAFSELSFPLFLIFPFIGVWALGWWAWGWLRATFTTRRKLPVTRAEMQATMTAALSMLALYDLILITLGSFDEYERLHLPFDPLMLLVVLGSLAYAVLRMRSRESAGVTSAVSPGGERGHADARDTQKTLHVTPTNHASANDTPAPDELEEASAV